MVSLGATACSRAVGTDPMPDVTAAPAAMLATPVVHVPAAAPGPVLPRGTFVARSRTASLHVWRAPSVASGRKLSVPEKNPVGQSLEFLVTAAARDAKGGAWLRVLLPIRPNGAAGWVKKDDVTLHRVRQRIVVDLSARTLRYFRDGRQVNDFTVGVGRPETPTAIGTFYVWAQVPQASPSGPYGVFALGLSGFSPVLKDWPGGGRMAIHGTPNPADQGQMVSHGCVRVYNPYMELLKHVPLGTPVVIRR
jgi:lipoprotein-anchoring transpeptidase ErfK/SrfK